MRVIQLSSEVNFKLDSRAAATFQSFFHRLSNNLRWIVKNQPKKTFKINTIQLSNYPPLKGSSSG